MNINEIEIKTKGIQQRNHHFNCEIYTSLCAVSVEMVQQFLLLLKVSHLAC